MIYSIIAVPAVGGHAMATWYLPPKDAHLTRVRSPDSADVQPPSIEIREALARAAMNATAPALPANWLGLPWLLHDLPQEIETAHILVYTHGKPEENSTIDSLATNLLNKVLDERKSKV